jgi:NhaP-type Na+/H+ or K+/H+ antiporter
LGAVEGALLLGCTLLADTTGAGSPHGADERALFIGLAGIFVLGIGAQWLAWRLRLPSILLLLLFGFLAGPVTHLVDPQQLLGELLFPLVSVCVGLILFEGGLTLRLKELQGTGGALLGLLTVGALVTWVLAAAAAYLLLDMRLSMSLLLGAILVVTGPTVVIPMLRHIRPSGAVGPIAKWEGIIIDPIGAVLAVLVFEVETLLQQEAYVSATGAALAGLGRTLLVGGTAGVAGAWLLRTLLVRHWVPDLLDSPMVLMVVVATFTGANLLQSESGLVAVTLMGVLLANQNRVPMKPILEFKERLSVLLISSLFILLGARLDVNQFTALSWRGPVFVALLILVVRPLCVLCGTAFAGLRWNERVFLAWLAPRGIVAAAVASVFALRLGDAAASALVPATFLVIVGTVAVYGLTSFPLARWLGLATTTPQGVLMASAHPGARAIAHALTQAGYRVVLVDNNYHHIQQARMEGLETCHDSVLSEYVREELDLWELGRLLALTPNDEVNSLACLNFSEVFGRSEVYRIATRAPGETRSETTTTHFSGRLLFGKHVTYEYLDERFAAGAVVKRTRLTREFDFERFRQQYGESAVPLFAITEGGKLIVGTADQPLAPKPGQTVIALVDPVPTVDAPQSPSPTESSQGRS